jgi:hypothetical protein
MTFGTDETVLRYVPMLNKVVTVTPSMYVPEELGIYKVGSMLTSIKDHYLVSYEYFASKTRPLNNLERAIYEQ